MAPLGDRSRVAGASGIGLARAAIVRQASGYPDHQARIAGHVIEAVVIREAEVVEVRL